MSSAFVILMGTITIVSLIVTYLGYNIIKIQNDIFGPNGKIFCKFF